MQQNHQFGKQWKLNYYRKSMIEIDDSCSSSYDMDVGGCASDMMLSPNSNGSGAIFSNHPTQLQHRHLVPPMFQSANEYSSPHNQLQEQNSQQPPPVQHPHPKHSPNSTNNQKFSIFSKLNNGHKANAFDSLMLLTTSSPSMLDEDGELTEEKKSNMENLMQHSISEEGKMQISHILEKIATLKPAERLLLYLKMPGGYPETGEYFEI